MKIAIDSWVLGSRFRHHGTYVYAMKLISEFKKISARENGVEFCVFASDTAANDARTIHPSERMHQAHTRLLDRDRLWRLGGASWSAARAGADLLFAPTTSILPLGTVPMISTIHDVTAVTMPSHSPRVNRLLRWLLWWTAKLARSIITGSQCSKADLMRIYGLDASQVHVVHFGCDHERFNDSASERSVSKKVRKAIGTDRPYILHHGTIQPRKNLERLIAAYRLLLSRNKDLELDLILAGELGWRYEGVISAAASSGPGRVLLPGALSDADLASLIKGAELAVIPSLYEGFCFPMVECMACGVPTIAANASCLPEISGGKLLYFDPYSIEDMSDCMRQALTDADLRRNLISHGKKRAQEFDWTTCARETLEVFKQFGGCKN